MSLSDEFDSPADLAKLLVERFEGTDDTAEKFLQRTLAELRAQEKGDGGDGGGDGGTPSPTIQRSVYIMIYDIMHPANLRWLPPYTSPIYIL
jgi:hypothetical protein